MGLIDEGREQVLYAFRGDIFLMKEIHDDELKKKKKGV